MIEKVDVRNEKMYISIISVRQMEAYVKSWVSLILGVRWARKQLLVPGETAPGPPGPLGPLRPLGPGGRRQAADPGAQPSPGPHWVHWFGPWALDRTARIGCIGYIDCIDSFLGPRSALVALAGSLGPTTT